MKIIYDCDNTMGMKGRDIDDGLALAFLLGVPEASLLAVTLTYGNDSLDRVEEKTLELKKELDFSAPVVRGRSKGDGGENQAAKKIVELVRQAPGEITLLATGSLTNISDACTLYPKLPDMVKEIVLMGGKTAPLIFHNREMNELNFSINHKAAVNVLKSFPKITVLTGNACMFARTGVKELRIIKDRAEKNLFIVEKMESWLREFKAVYGCEKIVLWDVIAAVYLFRPELFELKKEGIQINDEDMKTGFLKKGKGKEILFPYPRSEDEINQEIMEKVFGIIRGNNNISDVIHRVRL